MSTESFQWEKKKNTEKKYMYGCNWGKGRISRMHIKGVDWDKYIRD